MPVLQYDFNPRTPVGCDHGAEGPEQRLRISIHAPQWGATAETPLSAAPPIFQSTHPSGVRPARSSSSRTTPHFNPRTPVGCDPSCVFGGLGEIHFNPRTPVGCDIFSVEGFVFLRISIHAPQWGATHTQNTTPTQLHFNPRTPVGCDYLVFFGLISVNRFQSTHPSGVRQHHACAD